MLLIKKGQTNDISVSVSLNATLSSPTYLFKFVNILSKDTYIFYPKVILLNERYDEFQFIEGSPTNLSADPPVVSFKYEGQYWVYIYQMPCGSTSLNPDDGELIWDGRAQVIDDCPEPQYWEYISDNENNANFIFLQEDEICAVTPSITMTPTQTSSQTPTQTETPTQTPTPSFSPFGFDVFGDSSLNDLCSDPTGGLNIVLWGLNSVFENNTVLYVNSNLTTFAPAGFYYRSGVFIQVGSNGVVIGQVYCPTNTPTHSPTQTPTETPIQSLTPSQTETQTQTPTQTPSHTPTPSTTPGNVFCIDAGFDTQTRGSVITTANSIYVYGGIEFYQTNSVNKVVKLDRTTGILNGSFVPSFATDTSFVSAVAEASNGDLYFGGSFTNYDGQVINRIVKTDSTGSYISSFTANSNNIIYHIVLDEPNNALYVGGLFTTFNGLTNNRIVKLDATTGQLDPTFNSGSGFNSSVYEMAYDGANGLYVIGGFTSYNGVGNNRIIKLNATTGAKDATFVNGTGLASTPYQMVFTGTHIFVCGAFNTYKGTTAGRIVKIDTSGNIDATFATGTGFSQNVYGVGVDSSGRVICVGDFTTYNGTSANGFSALSPLGVLDSTFATNVGSAFSLGYSQTIGSRGITIDALDNIYVSGNFTVYDGNNFNYFVKVSSNGTNLTSNYCGLPRVTPTQTKTQTQTPSQTQTQTGTQTQTPTQTGTQTQTPTQTKTPTQTPTQTQTQTQTQTPSATLPLGVQTESGDVIFTENDQPIQTEQ